MLPLKSFSFSEPKNVDDLLQCLSTADARCKIIAGGTDLLPNLKYGLYDIDHLISLKHVAGLDDIAFRDNQIELGALVRLSLLAEHSVVRETVPALSYAAGQIASPQIRNMGTLGGNVCLDTRCLYFNQTEFWRSSLGYCLKKDGSCCHVVKTGKRCVAAASNDLSTVLLALGAKIDVISQEGCKEVLLDDFYTANGEKNNNLTPKEIVKAIKVDRKQRMSSGFFKLRHRLSIDFPLISVAVSYFLDDEMRLHDCRVVVNALVAKPKVMDIADFNGYAYNRTLIDEVARYAESKCHPQTNICDDPRWRKNMVSYAVKSAFENADVNERAKVLIE